MGDTPDAGALGTGPGSNIPSGRSPRSGRSESPPVICWPGRDCRAIPRGRTLAGPVLKGEGFRGACGRLSGS